MGVQLVVFKRDLRVRDHAALCNAAARGPVLGLYVYEPEMLAHETHDAAHLRFVNESLAELAGALRELHVPLVVLHGAMPEVLERVDAGLRRVSGGRLGIAGLHSHEETGHGVGYARDKRVAAWCRQRGIVWEQPWQFGVVRGLKCRDGWAKTWNQRMSGAALGVPAVDAAGQRGVWAAVRAWEGEGDEGGLRSGIRTAAELGVAETKMVEVEAGTGGMGGSGRAEAVLEDFLERRGVNYRADMSSPVAGWTGCSRLSAHLAYGTISLRRVHHAALEREEALRAAVEAGAKVDRRWLGSLVSFQARLRWHCHFMQKLEDEPAIEFRNINRAFDGLREAEWETAVSRERFAAGLEGRTGYPMVDAVMRCLAAGGWINFRMRAMVASFSAYHLWLHWREPAVELARRFLDFEPGIHFAQFQMQSGVTGINTVRIYSPSKQVSDQDPKGVFIRRWVPELEGVPDEFLANPEQMPALTQHMAGCVIGRDYPAPIVDHATAYREAQARIFARLGEPATRAAAAKVYQKHGSRKRPERRR
ncbi:MAG: deoxyribodipyrimidine photo-lyase/cryptochrome family protein [bacterium]